MPPPAPIRRWVAGETHRYLGRQYRLKIVQGSTESVRLSGAFFVVTVSDPNDRDAVRANMDRWYRKRAKSILAERMSRILKSTSWLKLSETPLLTIRTMRQRWGSATPSGRIFLNIDLIKVPVGCVDYVIAHELAHLKVPHHGLAFWRLLERVEPHWEYWRSKLDRQEI